MDSRKFEALRERARERAREMKGKVMGDALLIRGERVYVC
jgi:hypothetical protein